MEQRGVAWLSCLQQVFSYQSHASYYTKVCLNTAVIVIVILNIFEKELKHYCSFILKFSLLLKEDLKVWCNLPNYCVVIISAVQWSVVDSKVQKSVLSYLFHTVFWEAHQSQLLSALFQHCYCFAGWCSSGSDTGASTSSFESFHGNTADRRTESRWYSSQVSQPEKVQTHFCFVTISGEVSFYTLHQEKSFKII